MKLSVFMMLVAGAEALFKTGNRADTGLTSSMKEDIRSYLAAEKMAAQLSAKDIGNDEEASEEWVCGDSEEEDMDDSGVISADQLVRVEEDEEEHENHDTPEHQRKVNADDAATRWGHDSPEGK